MSTRPIVLITGSPRAGKTTLARSLTADGVLSAFECDDLVGVGWSEASDQIADLIQHGAFDVFEGVQLFRALRKLLKRGGRPCRPVRVILMRAPRVTLSRGQESMRKSGETIWREIDATLRRQPWFEGVDAR